MTSLDVSTTFEFGNAPILVFADHASNHVPEPLNDLGMSEDLLQTHIAWDIGAGDLAKEIAKQFSGTALLCGFSRLVVDANRDPSSPDLIPPSSDQVTIPGNQMLGDADKLARIKTYFDPYHKRLEDLIESVAQCSRSPFVISIHSFTKRMMGAAEDRPWNVGLLWREDQQSAMAVIDWLTQNTDWVVGDNLPYDARVFNYTVDRHVGPRSLAHLTLEIRQDMLVDNDGIVSTCTQLMGAIQHAMNAKRSA